MDRVIFRLLAAAVFAEALFVGVFLLVDAPTRIALGYGTIMAAIFWAIFAVSWARPETQSTRG